MSEKDIKDGRIAWGRGLIYNLHDPNPEIVTVDDIAYALAFTPRWRGQSVVALTGRRCFYGVGQHCVHGALEMVAAGYDHEHAFAFLFHELDEVIFPDMPGPAKDLIPGYRELAKRHGDALADKLGIRFPDPGLLKRWDMRMMVTEKRDLMPGYEAQQFQTSSNDVINEDDFPPFEGGIIPYVHPEMAAQAFLEVYNLLGGA